MYPVTFQFQLEEIIKKKRQQIELRIKEINLLLGRKSNYL